MLLLESNKLFERHSDITATANIQSRRSSQLNVPMSSIFLSGRTAAVGSIFVLLQV